MKPKRMRASASIQPRAKELHLAMTSTERILWERLRARRLSGLKICRQHPLGTCIADFYCVAVRLVIEIDGSIHHLQVEADAVRSRGLEAQGHRVIRLPMSKLKPIWKQFYPAFKPPAN